MSEWSDPHWARLRIEEEERSEIGCPWTDDTTGEPCDRPLGHLGPCQSVRGDWDDDE